MAGASPSRQKLPLEGVRVLELSHIVAGPSGGLILGDLGADVIKIEHPETGDTARSHSNSGSTFYSFNRNKKYLALDLGKPDGKLIFERLVAQSDVVLDNFAPGALRRLGLDYEWGRGVNPRIIYCSVKGFLPGPYADRPFLDELAQMAGGLAYLTGFKDQPMRAGASITDIGAATYGVIGILSALYRRERTGVGDCIDSGLYETIVFWVSQYITTVQLTGVNPPPRGSRDSTMGAYMGWGVYQLFPTRDGRQIFIAVTGNRHWAGLCDALDFGDWKHAPEFSSNRKRSAQKPRIAERVKQAVEQLTYDEIAARLYKALVPYSPVNTPLDLIDEKQLKEGRRWLHLAVGNERFKLPKLPIAMGGTAEFEVREQPGCLGEHTDSILAALGYSAPEIEKLKAERVVLRSDRMLNIGPRE
ncbi:MAG TPA: CaiB/BaiF CoA-transferase family protein [Burkholderiales bacterium]|nr:CaiB/BaiF CoA-transferase family protein [Burkholderiales bacterium]